MHAYADPRASARDRAFERLYRRYVKDVYRYTLALLRNPADAEDITQTTFLNAYRAYQRGEEPLKPQNWLIKIAHNACRTRYVRASRRPLEVPLEDSLRQLSVPADEIPSIKEVLDALATLPFNQRAAIVMRELEGRSYAEISQALEVSVPAVETLIFRARRALRLRRSALGTLVALPLPSSLSTFSGGGGAVVGSGGALLGSGLLLKAALAVGVGIVAGGVGTAVEAKVVAPKGDTATVPHALAPGTATRPTAAPTASAGARTVVRKASKRADGVVVTGETRRRPPSELPRRGRETPSPSAEGTAGTVAAPVKDSAPPAEAPASPPSPPAAVVGTGETAPVPVPAVPAVPAVPVVPVPAVPALPPPPPVEPPALPPPPPLPPPPSLP